MCPVAKSVFIVKTQVKLSSTTIIYRLKGAFLVTPLTTILDFHQSVE